MKDDSYIRVDPEAFPRDYGRLKYGELRDDDLVWAWPGGGFMRHDSPEWTSRETRAEHTICSLRSGRVDTKGYSGVRNYKISRLPAVEKPKPVKEKNQRSLFEEEYGGTGKI